MFNEGLWGEKGAGFSAWGSCEQTLSWVVVCSSVLVAVLPGALRCWGSPLLISMSWGTWLHVGSVPAWPGIPAAPEEGGFAALSILRLGLWSGNWAHTYPWLSLLRHSTAPWSSATAGTVTASGEPAASRTCRLQACFASPGSQVLHIAKLPSATVIAWGSLCRPPAIVSDGAGSSWWLWPRALSSAVPEWRAMCWSGAAICC